jgi:hypothetical protein
MVRYSQNSKLLKVSPCQVTFDEFYKMMTTPAPPLPPPVNSNKKKPYSDKLGGAKRRVAVSWFSVNPVTIFCAETNVLREHVKWTLRCPIPYV